MREHLPVEKGYYNLIEIFNDRRNQIVAEIEILKSKIELIDQQLAIHKDVSQTNPPPSVLLFSFLIAILRQILSIPKDNV